MPFLIALILIVAIAVAYLKTPKGRGWFGELCVKMVIGKNKPGVKYVLNDLKLRISDEKTSQIDHILINKKGIFVIETKNYSGRIYGQENQLEWTQVLNYGKVKNKLYNPVKQNKTHIYHISNIIGEKLPIHSVIVFVQGNVQYISANGIYTLQGLKKLVKNGANTLSSEQMASIYGKICEANDRSINKFEHIRNIDTLKLNVTNNICPRCGKNLIVRHEKNGDFMGCEEYPNCKFTKKI